ncbi:MAG: class I SAM-dependent methyltransferase [Thermoplasmatales archaeon]|nr:MAG: class I SAM-dependent methyltransferase [Thermoplasmatales archaeon]
MSKQGFIIDKALAEQFTRYMDKYLELYRFLAEKTGEHIQKSVKKPVIVEIGTGPGLLSFELHMLIPEAQVIGLDPSLHMLSIAENKLIGCKHCYFVKSSVENMPLKNRSADIVVSRFGLSSWKNPKKGFSEIFRVLKPGGRIVLEVLNTDFPNWKLLLTKIHMMVKGAGKNVIKYHVDSYRMAFSIKQVEEFLNETSFNIIKKEGERKDWKFLVIATKT